MKKADYVATVKKKDKIPLELLNMAIGYDPEAAELLRKMKKLDTTNKERARRRAVNKRARASRNKNFALARAK